MGGGDAPGGRPASADEAGAGADPPSAATNPAATDPGARDAVGPRANDARLAAALDAIDAANARDPTRIDFDGASYPKEVLHAQLMVDWVQHLDPGAGAEQLLAARAHHLRRWESPRSDYPEGRAGYLRWRAAAKRRHAEEVASLLAGAGYDEDAIERVQRIIRKEGLGSDPAVQTHEDALCLVFLQTQLEDTAAKVADDDRMVDVLRRTWAKMSGRGRDEALGLPLGAVGRALLERALAEGAPHPGGGPPSAGVGDDAGAGAGGGAGDDAAG